MKIPLFMYAEWWGGTESWVAGGYHHHQHIQQQHRLSQLRRHFQCHLWGRESITFLVPRYLKKSINMNIGWFVLNVGILDWTSCFNILVCFSVSLMKVTFLKISIFISKRPASFFLNRKNFHFLADGGQTTPLADCPLRMRFLTCSLRWYGVGGLVLTAR